MMKVPPPVVAIEIEVLKHEHVTKTPGGEPARLHQQAGADVTHRFIYPAMGHAAAMTHEEFDCDQVEKYRSGPGDVVVRHGTSIASRSESCPVPRPARPEGVVQCRPSSTRATGDHLRGRRDRLFGFRAIRN